MITDYSMVIKLILKLKLELFDAVGHFTIDFQLNLNMHAATVKSDAEVTIRLATSKNDSI